MKIYIDGACAVHTTKNGAWAFVVIEDEYIIHEDSGFERNTTNSRMEMTALIKALAAYQEYPHPIEVVTDSRLLFNAKEYLSKWNANGWRTSAGEEVLNKDLWLEIDYLLDCLDVDLQWTKGHSGQKWNEYVDSLCKIVAEQTQISELF